MEKHLKNWKHSSKYITTIYIWMSVFFLIGQIIFSGTILLKTYKQEVETNYHMNQQIFSQVTENVKMLDEEIRGLCNSLFVNPKVTELMYSDLERMDINHMIEEFQSFSKSILFSNPRIHSIYIYNRRNDRFLSSYHYIDFQDEGLREMMETEGGLPILTPIVRWIDEPSEKNEKTKVLTYVLYDLESSSASPVESIVVNVDFDRFISEINRLFTFKEEEESRIFIFDQNENVVYAQDENEETNKFWTEKLREMLKEFEDTSDQKFSLKTQKILGEKYGIFFTKVNSLDWTILKIQSQNEVFGDINRKLLTITVWSFLFCLLMLVLTYVIARKIYSPIGQLIEKVKKGQGEKNFELNDIKYLNQTYEKLSDQVKEYQKRPKQNKKSLEYNLSSLLIDGEEMDERVLESLYLEDNKFFARDNWFGVAILQIDDYRKLQKNCNHKDRELYKFIIENVLTEILENRGYSNINMWIENGRMVMILHGETEERTTYRKDMEDCFKSADQKIKEYFQISFSASVSSCQKGIDKIYQLYHTAEQQFVYRYVFGKETIVFYDYNAEQSGKKELDVIMDQLKQHIRAKDNQMIRKDFEEISGILCQYECENLMELLISIVVRILHMIDIKDKNNTVYGSKNFLEQYVEILSMETWAEMSEQLQKILINEDEQDAKETKKTNLLVDIIQKMVEEEFSNPNLCLQQIADTVKMSSQYVGRVFKGAVGISVSEYINEYRLKQSIDIMITTGCTVNEVLPQIGIEHESQYYRLFKKKYGVSPKAYILECLAERG